MQLIHAGELNAYDVLCNDWVVFSEATVPARARTQLPRHSCDAAARARPEETPATSSSSPVVSEKCYSLIDSGVYTFIVAPDANKIEIRQAIEAIFSVKVEKVNTLNRHGKRIRNRKYRRRVGKRPTRSGPSSPSRATTASRCSRAERRTTMGIRKRNPTSAGRRFQTVSDFAELTTDRPEKSLLAPLTKSGGRNSYGRKTARHRGGGHKRQYRIIDFKRNKDGVPAKVATIEYDPNRTCRIALLHYADGEKRYILAPARLNVGDIGPVAARVPTSRPATPCRCATSRSVRRCTTSSCKPGGGGKMARSAGMSVQLVAKEGHFATLRLPSTEMRRVADRLPGHDR